MTSLGITIIKEGGLFQEPAYSDIVLMIHHNKQLTKRKIVSDAYILHINAREQKQNSVMGIMEGSLLIIYDLFRIYNQRRDLF